MILLHTIQLNFVATLETQNYVALVFYYGYLMKIPSISGIIDRRILVNYKLAPEVAVKLISSPLTPTIVNGFAIVGVCLIRLKGIRPRFLPETLGVGSENAAYRFAVNWKEGEKNRNGVYIPMRCTSSKLNAFAGGRLFPGEHRLVKFQSCDNQNEYKIKIEDKEFGLCIEAEKADKFNDQSVFESLECASEFFKGGNIGFSETSSGNYLDGIKLDCKNWKMESLNVKSISSAYFDDYQRFPKGSIQFDNALLMRNIEHSWTSVKSLRKLVLS